MKTKTKYVGMDVHKDTVVLPGIGAIVAAGRTARKVGRGAIAGVEAGGEDRAVGEMATAGGSADVLLPAIRAAPGLWACGAPRTTRWDLKTTRGGRECDARATHEEIGHGEAEGLTAEFLRRRDVDRLRRGNGIDAFRVGRRFTHPVATLTLGGAGDIAIEARHARGHDLVAISLVDDPADPAADREECWIEGYDGHGEIRTG